jgi:pimeloyl-ACP methyl ester carboxylesterase
LKLKQNQQQQHQQPSHGILMDLRGHGKSYYQQQQSSLSSSSISSEQRHEHDIYTFKHCVQDVEHTLLQEQEASSTATETDVVVGHSWGGRIALEYAVVRSTTNNPLQTVWLLDTVPGQAHESVDQVIDAVTAVVKSNKLLDRKELINLLTQSYKMDIGIAQWLASSYNNKTGDFGFDLKLVQDIKPEFAHQDFIGLVRTILENNERRLSEDSNSTKTTTIHLVRGGKNKAWSIEILRQLESLAREYPTTLYLHVLPSAGHWVHVDDLPGLVELFAKHIDRPNTTISTQQQKQKRNGTGSSR